MILFQIGVIIGLGLLAVAAIVFLACYLPLCDRPPTHERVR